MIKDNTKRILLISAAIILMLTVALNLTVIWHAVKALFVIVKPIIIGFCIAFVLNLIMRLFERYVYGGLSKPEKPRRTLIRVLSLISTIITALIAVALILLVIIPQVIKTANSIVAGFPAFANRATVFVRELLERFDVKPERITELILGGEAFFDKVADFAKSNLNGVVKSVVSIGGSVVSVMSDVVFGLFIAIYFLADKDRVVSQCKRLVRAILKPNYYNKVSHIGRVAGKSFSNFLGGQFLEALILGSLCFIGMLIFRFPYAPVISVLVGVTALIPIVGAWAGGGISAVLILTRSPMQAFWFLLFFIVLQQIEGNFIYPKVVGKQVGLPGVWVLIAVVVGTGLFGAGGALLSVPLAAVVYALASEFVLAREKKRQEKNNDGPLE